MGLPSCWPPPGWMLDPQTGAIACDKCGRIIFLSEAGDPIRRRWAMRALARQHGRRKHAPPSPDDPLRFPKPIRPAKARPRPLRQAVRSKARRRAITDAAYPAEVRRTFEAYQGRCANLLCRELAEDPHHLVPRGRGGMDAGNILPLCRIDHEGLHRRRWRLWRRGPAEWMVLTRGETPLLAGPWELVFPTKDAPERCSGSSWHIRR